jgi:signal recognition particle subunit SRP54
VLLVGLQGSGKTTSAAKLAKHLVKKEGLRKPSLVAADLRRPAAIDQLETLAKNEGFDFRADRTATDVAAMVGRPASRTPKPPPRTSSSSTPPAASRSTAS